MKGIATLIYISRVAALIVAKDNNEIDVREYCKGKLSSYKIPSRVIYADVLPRNAMGKVNKKELKGSLFAGM